MTTTRILIAGLVLAGCAPQPGPIYIDKFYSVPSNCEVKDPASVMLPAESVMDVAAYPVKFWVGVLIKGADSLKTTPVGVGNVVLEPEGRSRVIVSEVVINYASPSAKLRGFKEWKRGTSLSFNSGKVFGPIQLISPEAADIIDNVEASNDPHDRTRLDVSVVFNGYISGTNSRISTGPLTLPITLTRTDSACTRYSTEGSGPCAHPGMDGEPLVCCTSTSDPGCQ